jgi:F-type H+-transporting ATPase subunit c
VTRLQQRRIEQHGTRNLERNEDRNPQEAAIVSKRAVMSWGVVLFTLAAVAPLAAQTAPLGNAAAAAAPGVGLNWVVASILTSGFALGIAAGLAAIGQGRAVGSAADAIARNPSAVADIRGAMVLGLVFIESLVIYALVVSLILLFINPFK